MVSTRLHRVPRHRLFITLAALLLGTAPAVAQIIWIPVQTPAQENLAGIDFPTSSTGYAVGDAGTIVTSTDGGATWQTQQSGVTGKLWGVRFMNADTGFACGDGGIIIATADGGKSWHPRNTGLRRGAVESFLFGMQIISPERIVAVGGDGETFTGVMLVSTDGGTTWSKSPVAGSLFLDKCSFIDENHGVAVGLSAEGTGIIATTADGGVSWKTQSVPALVNSVQLIDGQTGVAVGNQGLIYRIDGEAWERANGTTTSDLLDVAFATPQYGMAVGDGGTVLSTTDGGANWNSASIDGNPFLSDIHIVPGERRTFIAGPSGTVYRMGTIAAAERGSEMNEAIVEVIPNPVRGTGTLRVRGITPGESMEIVIHDMLGRQAMRTTIAADGEIRLGEDILSPGVYFYSAGSANGTARHGRFVVE